MEGRFVWRAEYNIGVEAIDNEHRRLFQIIKKLFKFQEEEKDSQWICQEGIKYFKGHTVQHFDDEEAYMASIGYEGLERHRSIHRGFREYTLPALEEELERTNYSVEAMDHFLGVCAGWLIGHTLTEDQAIKERGASTWENLLSEEEVTAMKKVIIHLVFDMFHLEAQAISDAYAGEKFGNGVYYRLVYGRPKDEKKQEVLMVFEEKLLVNTVGKALGLPASMVERQPFPGPGLGVRCLGAITRDRLEAVRESDAILREEFAKNGLEGKVWQYFTAIPDLKSVGVRDNRRTDEWCVIIRAVNTVDAMTATVPEIPWPVLQTVTSRVLSEVPGVCRVLYDLTPKPVGTIEWE